MQKDLDMTEKKIYNPWPIGKVPKEFQRPELDKLKELGYEFNDAREVVTILEQEVAKFSGSNYAIAVDCASNGLFLCLKYLKAEGDIIIPKNTYCSVPQQIIHAGCNPILEDIEWTGVYQLKPYPIIDAAVRWKKNAYKEFNDSLYVISFQIKKIIPTGKMGIILTNDIDAYQKIKLMSYDGRDLTLSYDDPNHVKCLGYHMYATPEDCARTLALMNNIKTEGDSGNYTMYPDLSKWMNKWQ